jgi:hypothetical protein
VIVNFFAALCILSAGMYADSGNDICLTDDVGGARVVYAHNYTPGGGLIQALEVGDYADVFEGTVNLGVFEVVERYTTTGRQLNVLIASEVLSNPQAIVWVTTDPEREALDPTARIILVGVIQETVQT